VTRQAEWLSWPEAAGLVGVPVSTIDWYTRQGRIVCRPAQGQRPSRKRESVEEFAVWWVERLAAKQRKREAAGQRSRGWLEPPEPTGWVDTQEAGEILGVNRKHVLWLMNQGYLKAVKTSPRRWWVDEASARTRAQEQRREVEVWVSHVEAAAIVGCSPNAILRAAKNGRIERCEVSRSQRSLLRSSVVDFAEDKSG
jgi:hypothetical protein